MYHRDWVSHMVEKHWRSWNCPICPLFECSSPTILRNHVLSQHPNEVSSNKLESFVLLCGASDSSRCRGLCPLCSAFEIRTPDQYQNHIGQHFEQLAASVFPVVLSKLSSGRAEAFPKHSSKSHEQQSDVEPSLTKHSSTIEAVESPEERGSKVSSISDQVKLFSISRSSSEQSQQMDERTGSSAVEQAHRPKNKRSASEATISPPSLSKFPLSSYREDLTSPVIVTALTGVISQSSDRSTHPSIPQTNIRRPGCLVEAHKVRGSTGKKGQVIYLWTCCYCGHGGMNAQTTPACMSCGVARCSGG